MSNSSLPSSLPVLINRSSVERLPEAEGSEPQYMQDYSDMSSTEFRVMVNESSDPLGVLWELADEVADRYSQTVQIVDILAGKGDVEDLYDTVTEHAQAYMRAQERKAQKEALVSKLVPDEHALRRRRAQRQIDREAQQEQSFGVFHAANSGSTLDRVTEGRPDVILEGRTRYFSGIGLMSDRDGFGQEYHKLRVNLDIADKKQSGRKYDQAIEAATVYAYNAFYRLRGLENAINDNPQFAIMVKTLTQTIEGFRHVVGADIISIGDLSHELRTILESENDVSEPTLAAVEYILDKLRQR